MKNIPVMFPILFALVACMSAEEQDTQPTGEAKGEPSCVIASEREPDSYCTQQYEPVCGCNDKTYGNACMARIDGVQRWEPGECGEPPPEV